MSEIEIVFFSSSHFTNKILESIYKNKNNCLADVIQNQLESLNSEDNLLPNFWCSKDILDKILVEAKKYKININLVVSQPSRQNRDKIIHNPTVSKSTQLGLEVFNPLKINKEVARFKELIKKPAIALVASYGQIISEEVLDIPKYGFVNWHPSKLPLYRGATPMQTILSDSQTKTALTWIEMTKEMDAGDIILAVDQQIENTWNFEDLANKMAEIGSLSWALVVAVKIYEQQTSQRLATPQKGEPTFTQYLYKKDATFDPKNKTADQIYAQYKGFYEFPGTRFYSQYFAQQLKLVDAEMLILTNYEIVFENSEWLQVKQSSKKLTFLKCKDNTLIKINQAILENGKKLNFEGFEFKHAQI
jgi:methionyl-tRNA formyltransferase